MEKKNEKFHELVKKMQTLKETEKGTITGGFASLTSATPKAIGSKMVSVTGFCGCSDLGGMVSVTGQCSCTPTTTQP